jgi:hypothetical protein
MPRPITYWRFSLFLPVIGGLLGGLFGERGWLLTWGMAFVTIPYVAFAALMWWVLGRLRGTIQFFLLATVAPLIFLICLAVYGLGIISISENLQLSEETFNSASWVLAPTLVVAYGYVLVAIAGYLVLWARSLFQKRESHGNVL